ncbi:MAG: UbiX family flavin prenyltransferase [Acidobacteriota bacterium]|nr:MAG: UbiX family flavin prenyltransferase [Acidobacteriota bacterium]
MTNKRLVVGISGASAPIFGVRTLELMKQVEGVETHLVYSAAAVRTIELETQLTISAIQDLADVVYEPVDIAASISSGSFRTMGMIIAPCSMSTLACIATSVSKDLLTRAADVTLKERRPLVLLCRESPLHLGHLRRMAEATEMGAVIAPPIPSFYHAPQSIDDLINHSIGRALDIFGLDLPWMKRWQSPSP